MNTAAHNEQVITEYRTEQVMCDMINRQAYEEKLALFRLGAMSQADKDGELELHFIGKINEFSKRIIGGLK